jgi:hypothetical protein
MRKKDTGQPPLKFNFFSVNALKSAFLSRKIGESKDSWKTQVDESMDNQTDIPSTIIAIKENLLFLAFYINDCKVWAFSHA